MQTGYLVLNQERPCMCMWEISVGDVRVLVSANQAILLAAAGNAFTSNFVDLVNAPAQDIAVPDPDGRQIVRFLILAAKGTS